LPAISKVAFTEGIMFAKFLIKYYFKLPLDEVVHLGTNIQRGSMYAVVYFKNIWNDIPFLQKILFIIKGKWKPTDIQLLLSAQNILCDQLFGTYEDFGDQLFTLMAKHNSKEWILDSLTEKDNARIDGLTAFTGISTLVLREKTDFDISLRLKADFPDIFDLVSEMADRIPIKSFLFYLYLHYEYVFNEIRKQKHNQANSLIDYIYETSYIQQKTARAIYEFTRSVLYTESNKNEALLINSEINAIMMVDLVFSYLKASIEKIMVITSLTFEIKGLDSKKEHKKRYHLLTQSIPDDYFNHKYAKLFLDELSSSNLSDLNNYRSGLLHKKGIADLQPHNYSGQNAQVLPLRDIFKVMFNQHRKNTVLYVVALWFLNKKLKQRPTPAS
jgi:hypothetical protein